MAYVPAPGYQTAFSPSVPCKMMIAGGLRLGMVVAIQAKLPHKHNRFAVNLQAGDSEESDIAFHMNCRYDGRDRVVFNSCQGGAWKDEEIKKEMPFKSGKVFLIMIEVTRSNYLVTANLTPFYEFGHRLPVDRIICLQVCGDIEIVEASIVGNGPGTKGGLVMSASQADLLPMLGPPAICPTVPFRARINGGMIPRRSLDVKLHVNSNAKTFRINLLNSSSNDIALHINPRFSKSTLVRNSYIHGVWGEEETGQVTKNPFQHGEYYDISIRCSDKNYKVFLNGSHCFNFSHRTWNFPQVDTVEMEGDVKIAYVFF